MSAPHWYSVLKIVCFAGIAAVGARRSPPRGRPQRLVPRRGATAPDIGAREAAHRAPGVPPGGAGEDPDRARRVRDPSPPDGGRRPPPPAPTPPPPSADVATWRTLWKLRRFFAPHRQVVAFGIVCLAGIAAMDLLKPWPLKVVLDDILQPGADHTLGLLAVVAGSLIAIALCEGLLSYLLVYFLNRAGRTIVYEIRAALFDHVQRLSLQFHSRRSTGDLLTRLTSDSKQVRSIFTEWFPEILNSVLFLVGMAIVLLALDWRLALLTIGSVPVLFIALQRFGSRIREYSRAERRREGALASVAHEALGTIRLTHAFGREADLRRRFERESEASVRSGFAAAITEERFGWLTDMLAALATAAVLFVGVLRVRDGAITAGTLIVFVTYTRGFYKPLRAAVKNANRISRAAASVERIVELLEVSEGVSDAPGARAAPPLRGVIELQGVSFAYEPGRPVLQDVELMIPAGRTTALVGPTGAGKSTLASLVPRLYDPTNGTVRIDGEDVRRWTVASLRAQIALVPQESVLLSASIAENIGYGRPDATREEIVAAARAARADEFVRGLPDGYDTIVGERGETLSGGQRQRIAIARAIVRDAPIVILDEPLAGLDSDNAVAVTDALARLTAGRTVLLVTHDPMLIARADHFAELAGGRTVMQQVPR